MATHRNEITAVLLGSNGSGKTALWDSLLNNPMRIASTQPEILKSALCRTTQENGIKINIVDTPALINNSAQNRQLKADGRNWISKN